MDARLATPNFLNMVFHLDDLTAHYQVLVGWCWLTVVDLIMQTAGQTFASVSRIALKRVEYDQ